MTAADSHAPLLRGFAPHAVVSWYEGEPMSAQSFCAAALALSATLPDARHAINLCEHAPLFLLGSAAAWVAGQTLLLPPDRLDATIARLRDAFPDAYCLCDSPQTAGVARARGMRVSEVRAVRPKYGSWPPPPIALAQVVACLHTSGSTGEPRRHAKTWRELVGGAETLLRSFGSPTPGAALLGTVAPQHMFGFETTIMLTLQSGAPLLPFQPALPGDLGRALAAARTLGRDGVWLLTTPLQLVGFHTTRTAPGLARVITSTMPLDRTLAQAVERDWQIAVEEIYGCTEGGMLARRRPAVTSAFSAGDGIEFTIDAQGQTLAHGGHLPAPLPLADRIEIVAATTADSVQQFRLLGRDDDVVKIAGKRASLAGLTRILQSLPGVADAVFFLPTPDARRVCAAVVAPGVPAAQLRRELAAKIDPAFQPRPLLMVDRIPRGIGMKVAVASLRAEVKAPPRTTPSPEAIRARVSVAPDHPAFAGHFPGRPIVPGVLLLQRVEAELARHGYALREFSVVKFHATVAPGEAVDVRVELLDGDRVRFEVVRDGASVASGQGYRAAGAAA